MIFSSAAFFLLAAWNLLWSHRTTCLKSRKWLRSSITVRKWRQGQRIIFISFSVWQHHVQQGENIWNDSCCILFWTNVIHIIFEKDREYPAELQCFIVLSCKIYFCRTHKFIGCCKFLYERNCECFLPRRNKLTFLKCNLKKYCMNNCNNNSCILIVFFLYFRGLLLHGCFLVFWLRSCLSEL